MLVVVNFFSFVSMSLPSSMGRSFRKRRPCPRAVRIRRDLRARSSSSRTFTRRPDEVLQDILALLTRKSSSLASRLQTLQDLLRELPAWMEWTRHADAVVGSTYQAILKEDQGKGDGHDDDDAKQAQDELEVNFAKELIRLSGNVEYIDAPIVERMAEDEQLNLAFLNWLNFVHAPNDPERHARDEGGTWFTTRAMHDVLTNGWRLHIPSRTLYEPPSTPPRRPVESSLQRAVSPLRRLLSSPPRGRRSARIAAQRRSSLAPPPPRSDA